MVIGFARCNSDSPQTASRETSNSSNLDVGNQELEEDLPFGWVLLRFQGMDYACEKVGFGDGDCVRTYGSIPSYIGTPDQYCSNVNSTFPDCSELWYPDELEDYTFVQYGASDYVCEDSFSGFSFGDAECFRYSGGDPQDATGSFPDLYCSDSFSAVPTCDEDYFPSELEDIEFVTIDGDDYICENTFGGLECYEWYGAGSPRDAIGYAPDFYCNDWGECARDDFP